MLLVNTLGRHVLWSVMHTGSGVQNAVLVRSLFNKELFQIIPMHMINRKIIQGRKKRARRCPL